MGNRFAMSSTMGQLCSLQLQFIAQIGVVSRTSDCLFINGLYRYSSKHSYNYELIHQTKVHKQCGNWRKV